MAIWDDVRQIALGLQATSERSSRGHCEWRVNDKRFVWLRPLRPSDVEALGDQVPDGPILAARVEHPGMKDALLDTDPRVFSTTPHSDDYPRSWCVLSASLCHNLDGLIVEAWLARAPRPLAKEYLETRPACGS